MTGLRRDASSRQIPSGLVLIMLWGADEASGPNDVSHGLEVLDAVAHELGGREFGTKDLRLCDYRWDARSRSSG